MHRPGKKLVFEALRNAQAILPEARITRGELEQFSPKDLRECLREGRDDEDGRLHRMAQQADGCLSFYLG